MNADVLSADSTVTQALELNPRVGGRLIAHRTACVGCYLARFCTLRDAARYYGLSLPLLMDELKQASSDIIVSPGGTND